MVKRIFLFAGLFFFALALVGLFFAARAGAEETGNCYPADKIERQLAAQFEEEKVAVAATNGGQLIERWESANGAWTLLIRVKRNWLCVIVSGSNWRALPKGQVAGETS